MHTQAQAIAAADALTLLLNQQHGIAAALEEIASWISTQGGSVAAENALAALQVLDSQAKALTEAINQVRQG